MSTLLVMERHALAYAERGLPVFPLHTPEPDRCSCRDPRCPSPGKHPRTRHGLNDATTDARKILAWWRAWKDANIGMPTGGVSGIIALDVDGEAGSRALRGRHLPETALVRTGRGLHYLYAAPALAVTSRAHVLPSVDVRGEGGYVVAPPSLHSSGRRYEWAITPRASGFAQCPTWLVELAGKVRPRRTATDWRQLVADGVQEGQRHVRLCELAGYLAHRRLDDAVARELLLAWNEARSRPPLPVDEVVHTVMDIQAREHCQDDDFERRAAKGLIE